MENDNEKDLKEFIEKALIPKEKQPYVIPENWCWIKVGTVIKEALSGFSCSKINELKSEDENAYPHLRPNNIGFNNDLNLEKIVYIPKDMVDIQRCKLKKNDVLFNNTNSTVLVGRAVLIRDNLEMAFSNHITRLVIEDMLIKPQWLAYSLNKLWNDGVFARLSKKWVGQSGVNQNDLKHKFYLPLPPIDEQQRIVEKLDSMFSKLKETKDLIQEARESFESRMVSVFYKAFTGELTIEWREEHEKENVLDLLKEINYRRSIEYDLSNKKSVKKQQNKSVEEMLIEREEWPYTLPEGWQWLRLGDLCDEMMYGTSSKSDSEGIVPVLRMGNLQEGRIVWNDLKYTSNQNEIEKYKLKKGDILFNRTNSSELVGKTSIFEGEMEAIFAGYLIKIVVSDGISKEYINYFANSPVFKQMCNNVKSDGVNQSNINAQKLAEFKIPLPSLNEQLEIVKHLKSILKAEDEIQTLINLEDQINLIEKAIYSKAFCGKLATNNTEDQNSIILLEEFYKEKLTVDNGKKAKITKGRIRNNSRSFDINVIEMVEDKMIGKDIYNILYESKKKILPLDLYKMSGLDIVDFYETLKNYVESDRIAEIREPNGEIYLEAKK